MDSNYMYAISKESLPSPHSRGCLEYLARRARAIAFLQDSIVSKHALID